MMNSKARSPRRSRQARRSARVRAGRHFILAGSIVGALGLASAHAATTTYSWDPNGSVGTALGGTGTWNTTDPTWYNGSADVPYVNGSATAVFGGTAGAVTLGVPVTAGALTFSTDGYTIAGGAGNNLLTLVTGGALSFPAITVGTAQTATITAALDGTAGFHLLGGGTLVLGGTNSTLTGMISIDAGTLVNGAAGALNGNAIALQGGGDLQVGGNSTIVGGLTGTDGIVENANATAATLTIANTVSGSFGGVIQDGTVGGTAGGALSVVIQNPVGVAQTLSGNSTFTGGLTLASGTLNLASGGTGTASPVGTGILTINGGVLDNTSGAALTLSTNNAIKFGGNFTFTGTNSLTLGTGGVTLTAPTAVTLGGSVLTFGGLAQGTNDLTFTGPGSANLAGTVSGSGAFNVGGGSTVTMGVANSFTGAVNLDGANTTLIFAGTNSSADPTPLGGGAKLVTLTNGATLKVITAGSNPTNGSKNFFIGAGGGTFDIASGIYLTLDDGNIATGVGPNTTQLQGTGDLLKKGLGTLNLGYSGQVATGFLTSYSGNITVAAGILAVGNGNALGANTATSITTVQSGASLDFYSGNSTLAEILTIGGAGAAGEAGALTNSNNVTVTESGAITITGDTTIGKSGTGGTLSLTGGLSGTGNLTLNSTGTGTLTLSAVNTVGSITNSGTGAGLVTISGAIGAGVTAINQTGTAPLTISSVYPFAQLGTTVTSTGAGLYTLSGGVTGTFNLKLSANSTGGITLSTGAVNHVGTITNISTGTGTVTISSAIGTNVTGVSQTSTTSPLVLTGANTYTSATTIAAGTTLQLGDRASNNQALAAGSAVSDAGTLIFAPGTTALTYGNVISGNGSIVVNGLASAAPASITLSGNNTPFTGTYTMNQGRIAVAAQTNLGPTTDVITVNGNSATLTGGQLFITAAVAIANPITLNGYGPTEGAGNLGAIRLNTSGDSYTGPITLGSNASINTSNTAGTVSSIISGPSGAQLLIGTPISGTSAGNAGGTLTLNVTNTYAGGTLIQGETAALAAVGALGTGPVTVSTTSNSALTESVANALTGSNSLNVLGGTVTLSLANNFTAGTSVSGGTLNATAAGALPGNVTTAGGTLNNNAAGAITGTLNFNGGTFGQTAALNAAGQALNVSAGTVNLSQVNTYGGGTNIIGGIVNVSVPNALPGTVNVGAGTLVSTASAAANAGVINLNGGTLSSGLTGTFGTVTGGSITNTISPGGLGGIGTLTIGTLNTGVGTVLLFDENKPYASGAPANTGDLLVISANNGFNFNNGVSIAFNGPAPSNAGNYRLIQYTGAVPAFGNVATPIDPRGSLSYSYDTTSDPGFIDLAVSGSATIINTAWLPTSGGGFSYSNASNWDQGFVPNVPGDTANFNSVLTGAQTVTLDGSAHVGTLIFNSGGPFGYTLTQGAGGGVLSLDNGGSDAVLSNLAQNNAIGAPVSLVSNNTNVTVAAGTNLTLSGGVTGAGRLTMSNSSAGTLTLTGAGSYTGGTEIDGGTIVISAVGGTASQLNNAGVGTTTLNGGTLSFTATTGQTSVPQGFFINVGPAGGTLNNSGSTTNGKLFMSTPGQFTGSGTLTKTGGGDLQISTASVGFTGNVNLLGLVEWQNVAALGTVGIVTVGAGGELVAGGVPILNPINLTGGTLSSNSTGNLDRFANTVTVSSSSTLAARQFQTTTAGVNFGINVLTGPGNLNVIGGTTSLGMVTLGNASNYTGTIAVGTGGALGIGDSTSGNFFGSSNPIAVTAVSGAIGLVDDGDGTSTPQTRNFTLPSNPINFVAANTGGYLVGKQGAGALFNQAANKTIALNTPLPLNNTNILNVTPLNGYGLLLTAQPALAAITTFSVGGTQASNVVPGLTLSGLTGGFGLVKTGTGTLRLGTTSADASNTFGGAGSIIDIQGGIVTASSAASLGDSNNAVKLNTNNAAQGFRADGTWASNRTFTLAVAANDIEVTGGNTLTLNTGLAYAAVGNALTKNDNGTLVLTAAATGAPTSGTTLNAGVLQISNSNQLGTGTITVANIGSSLQLSGGATFTQALAINSQGLNAGKGALDNLSGANSVSGTITISGGSLITNEDTANVFTLGAIANTTTGFNVGGAGNTTVTGVISGAGVVNATGPGQLRLTAAETVTGAVSALGGNLIFSGAGADAGGNVGLAYGGNVTFDNSTTNLNNRAGSHLLTFGAGGGGIFTLAGNAGAATTETLLSFTSGRGEQVIAVNPNAAQASTLTLTATGGAFTHAALGSVIYQAPGLGNTAAAGVGVINEGAIANTSFQGVSTAGGLVNQQVQPWALAYDTNKAQSAITFATASGATGANYRQLASTESLGSLVNFFGGATNSTGTASTTSASTTVTVSSTTGLAAGEAVSGSGIPAGAYIASITDGTHYVLSSAATATATGVVAGYSAAGTNVALTSAQSGPSYTLAAAANSLTLAPGGALTLLNTQTLTLGGSGGGGILATDTASGNTISGPGILTAGTAELDIHTIGNLTINSAITGGAGGTGLALTKGESGTLTLGANSFYTGQTVVNAGTLSLNAGNNTIQYSNFVAMGANATLNLNGNAQFVTDLFSDTASLSGLGVFGANSTVTGTAGSLLAIKGDGSSRNFTGAIGGAVTLVHSATAASTWTLTQNQTYTGPTLINGGTVDLQNNAQLSGTSALTINRAVLALDNNGSANLAARIPVALPISLGGGTLTFIGRAQFASAESVGAVSTTEGANSVTVTQQTTGVSTAALTLASLSRAAGSTVNFTNSGGTLGLIGSNPNILITANPALTNSLIGGGYTVNGADWASYNPTFGVGALGAIGFAGYSPNPINTSGAADNVSMAAGTAVNLNSETINSLRITGTTAIGFNPGQTLTLASGGLLVNANLTLGSSVNSGTVTSGGNELFLYVNGGTSTINSALAGTGVSLVKSGGGTITAAGTNTYTGGTYINQGTLTLGLTGQLGTGGVFLNGGTLTQTAGSVIPAQAFSITGGSTLTLNPNLAVAGSVTTAGSNVITVPSTTGIAVGQPISGTGLPAGEFVTAVNPANNTVTVSTGTGVTAGTNTLTFVVNNTAASIALNNDGGTAPTLTPTGLLTVTGAITASSNNISTTSTIGAGTLDLANQATPKITVSPIAFNGKNLAPLQPTLSISSVIQNASNALSVTGGGNLQLSGQSTFTGGLNLGAGTALTIAGNSTTTGGALVSGPVGTGQLSLGAGSALYVAASQSLANAVSLGGNLLVDDTSTTAATLTLAGAVSLPGSATTTVTVNAPQAGAVLSGVVSGSGSALVKSGLGALTLSSATGNTFDGGFTLNAGTVTAIGSGPSFGSGPLAINGGLLQLRSNAAVTTYGNNVTLSPSLSNAFIDINNNGTGTGNLFRFGTLTSQPSTVLNISGGNSSRILFTGTNLTSAATPATFNPAAGLTVILPGGFTDTNRPVDVGAGLIAFSGNNNFTSGTTVTGTQAVAPVANSSSTPYGTGTVTLANGSTLQVTPLPGTLSSTGYTQGGLAGRYYGFTGGVPSLNTAGASGLVAAGVVGGVSSSDTNISNHVAGVITNAASPANTIVQFSGLLNVTGAGTYNFGINNDDQGVVFIDGLPVARVRDNTGTSGGFTTAPFTIGSIQLSAGLHQIVVMQQNGGGGSGVQMMYSGPDTSSSFQNIALGNLYGNTAGVATAANGYLNAGVINNAVSLAANSSATLDGAGSQLNSAVASLNLGNSSTLTVNNVEGSGFLGSVGAATVGSGVTLNTNTGTLYLIGGVSDGGNGLVKTGNGTLILGSSAGNFTGPLTLNAGYVQLAAADGLSTGTTTLNPNAVASVALTGGSDTSGSNIVTVASTGGLTVGQAVTGTGIPAGSTVTGIISQTQFYISNFASSTNTSQSFTAAAATQTGAIDLNGIQGVTGGTIVLNGSGPLIKTSITPAALYNSSASPASVSSGTTVSIGSATGAIAPSIGGFGDIELDGVVQDGTAGLAWSKVGPDTLTLANAANSFTGALTVAGGTLRVGTAGALGSSATGGIIVSSGAVLDLNGVTDISGKTLTLSGAGLTGLAVPNTLAALVNNSGTPAGYSGSVVLAAAASVGSSSFPANNTPAGPLVSSLLSPSPSGNDISLTGVVSGAFLLSKTGTNTLFLSNAETFNNLFIPSGAVVLQGNAVMGGTVSSNVINPGGTFVLDNTGTNINNRLGGRGEWLAGNFTILGNSGAPTTEAVTAAANNFAIGNNSGTANAVGQSVITLIADPAQPLTLQTNSTSTAIVARNFASTLLIRGTNLGLTAPGTPGNANFIGGTTSVFATSGVIGQTGAITAPNAAILPWALVDSTATGHGTGFAAYDPTNGFIPLPATGYNTSLAASSNVVASADQTAAPGSLAVNSLTLNGANVNVGAGSTVQLLSGGLLAIGTETISGSGYLAAGTTAGTLSGEFIVHTPNPDAGGNTVLTINTPIATTGGLTKADGGTLILGAQNLYTGTTTLNGGTVSLTSKQALYITPTAGVAAGATAGATVSGQVLQVNYGATLDLNGNNLSVANLNSTSLLPNFGGTVTNSSANAANFQVSLNANQTFAGSITGKLNFIRTGGFTFTLEAPSSYTGTTTIQSGSTILQDLGALTGTSAINLNGGALVWNGTGTQSVGARVPATAPFTFNTGAFTYNARSGTQGAIALGNFNLATGSSLVTLNPTNGSASLNLGTGSGAAITRSIGTALTFNSAAGIGDNVHVSLAGQASGLLGGWATVYQMDTLLGALQPEFAVYNSNGLQSLSANLVTLATNAVPAGVNARINANVTLPAGGATLNTLSALGTASTLTFAAPTDTLTVSTGGILTNIAATIGASAGQGKLTAGSGQGELFLHSGTGALTINSAIADNGVSGGLNVVADVMAGAGTLVLTAPNTYLGTTYLNGIATTLNSATGPSIPGNLVLTGGVSASDSVNATTTLAASNQIAPSASVIINGGATLSLGAFSNTIANLTLNNLGGGNANLGANVATGAGALTVTGNVTVTPGTNSWAVPTLAGNLTLSNASPTISVAANTMNPLQLGLELNAALTLTAPSTTPLSLQGGGVIALGGQSTFTNTVAVTGGTTLAFGPTANGAVPSLTNADVDLAAGTTLDARGNNGIISSLTGTGTVTNTVGAGGTVTLAGNVPSASFTGVLTNGPLSTLSLVKNGPGTQTLLGNVATFTGATTINGGTLALGSGSGLTGAVIVNNGGTLGVTATGNVNVGSLTLNSNSALSFAENAGGPTATLNSLGAIAVNGSGTINLTGAASAPGTYALVKYQGAALTNAQIANLVLAGLPAGTLGVLRNDTANSSIDLAVEAAGAANLWTGAGGGTWNPGDATNWQSAYADGQQVTFDDTGAVKNISGGTVAPQKITFNNSTSNYVIANNISGNLAGGIVKNGTGIAQLTGVNTGAGPVALNGGTLRVTAASTGVINASANSALGAGAVTLNGGTLQIDATASTANAGLFTRTFTGQATGNADQVNFTNNASSTATNFAAGPFTFSQPAATTAGQFLGKLSIATAGQYALFSSTDDGARVYVDGVLVIENDGGKSATEAAGTLTLTPGLHDLRVDFVNNAGAGSETLSIQGPGLAKQQIPASMLSQPEATATGTGTSTLLSLGNNVTVASSSTINLAGQGSTGVQIGGVTSSAGSTLTVLGDPGKMLRATNTNVTGTVGYNTTADFATGALSDFGTAATIVKTGAGRLVLDSTATGASATSLVAGTTFDIQAGKLVLVGLNAGTDPAGSAKLQLNGGGLLLDTKFSTVAFDNAVNVVQSGLLEVVPDALTTTLGSAANGVTLGSGTTLTVDVYGGSRGGLTNAGVSAAGAALQVNGVISGATGNLVVQSNQAPLINMYPVYGSMILTAAETFGGSTTLNGGYVNNATPLTLTLNGNGALTATSAINLNNARLTMDNSGTNVANRVADATPVTLNNSVLNFIGSTTATASETLGAVTANAGFNQVTMSNVFATGSTTLTLGLTRANNSQLAFYGASLGGAATNADLIKFPTAPTLSGAGGAAGSTTMSILPYAVAAASGTTPQWGLTTYDVNGIRPLAAAEYKTLATSTLNTDNVRDAITAATNLTGKTVNAYVLDNTATSAQTATLGGTLTSTSGAVVLAGTVATGATAPGALTLTGGTVEFGAAEGVVTVTNSAGAVVNSVLDGTGGLTYGGYGSLTLSGANTFSGQITVNGTSGTGGAGVVYATNAVPNTALILNSASNSVLGAASNPISLNGGAIRFGVTGVTIAATHPVTLGVAGGTFDTGAFSGTVAANVSGSGALNKLGGNTLTLSGTNSFTGPVNIYGGTLFENGALSTSYTLANAATVQLDAASDTNFTGTIAGVGSFTKSNVGNLTVSTPQSYIGTTAIFGATSATNGTVIVTADNFLPSGTSLQLGAKAIAGAMGNLDLTAANQTINDLTVYGDNALASQVKIGAGKTLTVLGNTTIGFDPGSGTAPVQSRLAVSGAGNLSILGATVNVGVNSALVGATYSSAGTLDLTNLTGSFNANVTTLNLGVGSTASGTGNVLLTNTSNTILAGTLTIGDTGGNNGSGSSTMTLGTGTNVLQVDTLNIGRGKGNGPGFLKFASQTPGSPGSVSITNKAGTGPVNITVANVNLVGTAGGAVGTLDLTGHNATINAGTLLISNANSTSSASGTTGTVSFDTGRFDVATLNMAAKSGASTGTAVATLNVGGGVFNVNSAFTLGSQSGSGGATATLNVTGGTFTSHADILDGGGADISSILLSGGTLDLTGHNLGSGAVSIDSLTLTGGTLQNVASINGTGGLTKSGAGTLILSGTNTYTGPTIVGANSGSLQIARTSALANGDPTYLTAANLTVNSGSTLALNVGGAGEFAAADVTNISSLGTATGGFQNNSALGLDTSHAGGSFTYGGVIANPNGGANAIGLTKLGSGTLVLSSTTAQAYTGPTNVSAGTLEVHGGISGSLNIAGGANFDARPLSGSTLNLSAPQALTTSGTGTGTLLGSLNTSATVSPGGAGTLGALAVTGSATLNGAFNADLGAARVNDSLTTTSLTLGSGATLNLTALTGAPTFGDGSLYTLVNDTGTSPITGFFSNTTKMSFDSFGSNLDVLQASNGQYFAVSYTGENGAFNVSGGNDVVLMAVPEPSAVGSLLVGVASLAGLQRFRRRVKRP